VGKEGLGGIFVAVIRFGAGAKMASSSMQGELKKEGAG